MNYLVTWRERGTVWRCHGRLISDFEAALRVRDEKRIEHGRFVVVVFLDTDPDTLIQESERHGRTVG